MVIPNPVIPFRAKQPELSVFLPAYGEAENLNELLPRIKKVIADLGISAQITVVDAPEPIDNTAIICGQNEVNHLHRQGGNRYGDAVRTGILASTGQFIISMDSDGSHNPEFIRELWTHRQEAEVVIASRYIHGGVTENPWTLVAMSRLLNIIFRLIIGLPAYDISNSFRLYRGDLLRSIHPKYANFDVLEEILVRMLWENPSRAAKILEIPFRFEQRKHGKPKRKLIVFGIQFVLALVKLSFLRIRNQFNPKGDQ